MLVLNNLTLREFRRSDLPEIARGFNDRGLATLAQPTAPKPVPLALFEQRFDTGASSVASGGSDDIEFVVTRTDDDASTPLGVAGLYDINWPHGLAEIGVLISSDHARGHGLGIDCYVALADYAFHDLRLNRVCGSVKAGNAQALGTLRRINLTPEGTLRQARFRGGRFEDLTIVAMTADGWDPALRQWRDATSPPRTDRQPRTR